MAKDSKRFDVFSIKEVTAEQKSAGRKSFWMNVGTAWQNQDGSLNVTLQAFPVDGKLHIREYVAKEDRGEKFE